MITPEGPITTNAKNCTSAYSPTGPDLCSDYYGWTDETSLDVEWSHVMAPKANILLVETPMTETEGIYGFPQIVAAENYVIDHHLGDVITQSFGANEQTFTSPGQIYSLRSAYINAARHGVTVLAASGDQGSTDDFCDPSSGCAEPEQRGLLLLDPGDRLARVGPAGHGGGRHPAAPQRQGRPDRSGQRLGRPQLHGRGDRARLHLGASGGGHSAVFSRPRFQDGVAGIVGDSRGTPDISMSAAVNGAVDFYDTTDPSVAGWGIVGGTSEASPLFSGIVALADQVAGHSLGDLNPALYAMAQSRSARRHRADLPGQQQLHVRGRRGRSPGGPPTPAGCGGWTGGSPRRSGRCSAPRRARWWSTWASVPRR